MAFKPKFEIGEKATLHDPDGLFDGEYIIRNTRYLFSLSIWCYEILVTPKDSHPRLTWWYQNSFTKLYEPSTQGFTELINFINSDKTISYLSPEGDLIWKLAE